MATYRVVFDTGADLLVPGFSPEEARLMCGELFPDERIVSIAQDPCWGDPSRRLTRQTEIDSPSASAA